MPSDTEPADSPQPASFETALAALAEIVSRLESGSLGLADSIAAYERGVALLRRLHEELGSAEEKVATLVRIDDDGRPLLAPIEPVTPGGEAAKPARSAGRRQRSRTLPGMDDGGGDG